MTFFFALHPILGGKLDICERDDLFFALHPILGGKLDIILRTYDDLFFYMRNPRLLFFWSTTLNLTHHLKRFAIPVLER